MDPPPDSDLLLDRRDLMRRWRCSVATIKRREITESLRPIRIGPRLVRYRMADILAYEEAHVRGKAAS